MRRLAKTLHKVFSPSGKGLGEKGFTLIELLVVIGILAVLAGVVTLSVGKFIGKGATEAALTDQHNVQTAIVAYQADNLGVPPATIDLLVSGGYLLTEPEHYTYTWDATTGAITGQTAK
ncbi:MAG: type II secretion system protein [Chloroflexi bacterium]|jgi:prepilin-type N-terminal cleavage/methylation domain-containing protein|nr:type II secretion system protein [Chloroflexota bacterium]